MYLYVKTHNKTGLKYLGKTNSDDPHIYPGSGVRWTAHLKKHGYDYTTEILLETNSEQELVEKGIYYSHLWNVVESPEWANLKIEEGDGGDTSKCPAFQNYVKNKDCRGDKNSFYGKKHNDETKKILAEKASKQWKGTSKSDEHKRKIAKANTGKIFTEERKRNISLACKGRIPYNKGKPAERFVCGHCRKEIGGASNFKRWHGDNCKEKL